MITIIPPPPQAPSAGKFSFVRAKPEAPFLNRVKVAGTRGMLGPPLVPANEGKSSSLLLSIVIERCCVACDVEASAGAL